MGSNYWKWGSVSASHDKLQHAAQDVGAQGWGLTDAQVWLARDHAVVHTETHSNGRSGHGLQGEGEGMKLPIKSPLHPALHGRQTFRGGETSTITRVPRHSHSDRLETQQRLQRISVMAVWRFLFLTQHRRRA